MYLISDYVVNKLNAYFFGGTLKLLLLSSRNFDRWLDFSQAPREQIAFGMYDEKKKIGNIFQRSFDIFPGQIDCIY